MARQASSAQRRSTARGQRPSQALVHLASRLLVAQAGASAAIGIGYSRRNQPWLVATVILAFALCGLAALVRTRTHAAWLVAVSAETCLVAIGLFRFAYARYMGGSLLAIVTLGTLLHPAVADALGRVRQPRPGDGRGVLTDDATADALREPAVG